jgi:nitrite reductase/ring-hydroxylating ferredoxin subunit
MPFIKVATLGEVPPDSVIEVSVGENLYAICNINGEIHALDGICPHQGGYLGQGNVADGRLICPWHGWEFDCRTGENCLAPGEAVPTYPVAIQGSDILLQVP